MLYDADDGFRAVGRDILKRDSDYAFDRYGLRTIDVSETSVRRRRLIRVRRTAYRT